MQFTLFFLQKHIIGEVKEKEKAHKEYKEAIAAGHGAYLMDEGISFLPKNQMIHSTLL
jgi:hypothetical protein